MNFLNVNSVNNSSSEFGVLGLAPNPSAAEPYKSFTLKLKETGVISRQVFSLQLGGKETDSSLMTIGGYDETYLR